MIKLAIASPVAPISGIGPYPNTKMIFKPRLTKILNIVSKFGKITISNACKNSFDMQCKYAPKTEKAVTKK